MLKRHRSFDLSKAFALGQWQVSTFSEVTATHLFAENHLSFNACACLSRLEQLPTTQAELNYVNFVRSFEWGVRYTC